jgi:protein translocase SecG subunit
MILAITIIHVIVSVGLILVVLLQTGKGAEVGAVFGGSSSTIFGSSGAGNFLTRLTTGMAIVFMMTLPDVNHRRLFLTLARRRRNLERRCRHKRLSNNKRLRVVLNLQRQLHQKKIQRKNLQRLSFGLRGWRNRQTR